MGRYWVSYDGKAVFEEFDSLEDAARFAMDQDEEIFSIYDKDRGRFLTGAEVLLAAVSPRKKADWQKGGF